MLNVNKDTCKPGYHKIYIEVNETISASGHARPHWFKWIDGNDERKYDIDKILEIKQTYAPNVGGLAVRYKVLVGGKEKYLWYEGPAWFVEMYVRRL